MNEWDLAALILTAALIPCVGVCLWAGVTDALAALEVVAVLASTILVALSEGFHRQSFVDLAVILVLVSLVGTLAVARLMEREL